MPETISASFLNVELMNPFNRTHGVKERPETGQVSVTGGKSAELKKACAEFESLFIFHLLKEMRSTIPKTGLLNGGRGEELYTSMFDAQIAKELASERGIGLSTLLLQRLGSPSGPEEKNSGKE